MLELTQKSGSLILVSCLALNISLARKHLLVENALAYFSRNVRVEKTKSFITLRQDFSFTQKLEVLNIFLPKRFFILFNFLKRLNIFVIQHFVKFAFFVMYSIPILARIKSF